MYSTRYENSVTTGHAMKKEEKSFLLEALNGYLETFELFQELFEDIVDGKIKKCFKECFPEIEEALRMFIRNVEIGIGVERMYQFCFSITGPMKQIRKSIRHALKNLKSNQMELKIKVCECENEINQCRQVISYHEKETKKLQRSLDKVNQIKCNLEKDVDAIREEFEQLKAANADKKHETEELFNNEIDELQRQRMTDLEQLHRIESLKYTTINFQSQEIKKAKLLKSGQLMKPDFKTQQNKEFPRQVSRYNETNKKTNEMRSPKEKNNMAKETAKERQQTAKEHGKPKFKMKK